MIGTDVDARRSESGRGGAARMLVLAAFAVVIFLAGRYSAIRAVQEARRQAGLAERGRLEVEAELDRCRNARLLERRGGEPPGDRAGGRAVGAGRTPAGEGGRSG